LENINNKKYSDSYTPLVVKTLKNYETLKNNINLRKLLRQFWNKLTIKNECIDIIILVCVYCLRTSTLNLMIHLGRDGSANEVVKHL
jgi:hypothetical protein